MKSNIVIIISGATATGKTATSIQLARSIRDELGKECVIVNFDSLLFYRELNIGTAKPSQSELDEIPHKLIDVCSLKTPLNASDYKEIATKEINEIHYQQKIVILTGGSGFYLRALIKGMYEGPKTSPTTRTKADKLYKEKGIGPFLDILRENDPESCKNLHPNDHYRIIRAVEYFWESGQKISKAKKEMEQSDPFDFSTGIQNNWNMFHCYLDIPKDIHLNIIEERTRKMIKDGLIEEVQKLLDQGHTGTERPMESIGYKEVVKFLQGKFNSLDECMERIVISTRQLAKSQRTFFKKIDPKKRYDPLKDQEMIIKDVIEFIN